MQRLKRYPYSYKVQSRQSITDSLTDTPSLMAETCMVYPKARTEDVPNQPEPSNGIGALGGGVGWGAAGGSKAD